MLMGDGKGHLKVRKVSLDCDPGHDDAMAIILAEGLPELDLIGIMTVAGNQTLDKTTLSVRRVCTVAHITDVPICAGSSRPILHPLVTEPEIHGESGLDGPRFPEPTVAVSDEHAVDLIVRQVLASGGDIAPVAVGPLTNIALALRREPRIAKKAQEVVLMGGSTGGGNWTPAAGFNILADPEAAAIIFGAPWSVTMVGLNVTYQARAGPEIFKRLRSMGTPLSQVVIDLLQFFWSTHRTIDGENGPPIHDACAVDGWLARN